MRLFERYKNLPKGLKASLWFTIASLLQKGIAFIATPFYTRLLTTSEYGYFATYTSWLSILTIFATLNLSAGVMNNLLTNKEKYSLNNNEILSNLQFLELLTISFFSALVLVFNHYFPDLLKIEEKALIMMCITILANSALSLLMTREKFDYNFIPIIVITLFSSLLIPIANILLIKYGNDNNYALIYGTVLVSSAVYFPILIVNLFRGKKFFSFEVWRYAILFNLPLLPHYLSLVILSSSDKIMIERIQDTSFAALYAIPLGIVSLVTIFSNSINASLIPTTYKKLKDNSYKNLSNYVTGVLFFFASLIFGLMLLGPEAIFIMGGEEYMEAIWVLPPLAASVFFSFLYPLFANVEFFYEKRIVTTFCSLGAAALNILLNAIFVYFYGYIAAAFTTLICYLLLSLLHYVAFKIICKKKKLDGMYNEKIILILSFVILFLIFISYLLYLNRIVRYVTIGVTIAGVLVFIKPLIRFFREKLFIRT